MVILHKPSETNFNKNGKANLKGAIVRGSLTHKLNGACMITIEMLKGEPKTGAIKKEDIISCPTPFGIQSFRVFDINPISVDRVQIVARHIFFDLQKRVVKRSKVDNSNGQFILDKYLLNLDKPVPHKLYSNLKSLVSLDWQLKKGVDILLGDEDNSFINKFGKGELRVDGFKGYIDERIGRDRGFKARFRKNITGFSGKTSTDGLLTRIIPKGFDGITLPNDGVVDSELINNYADIYANVVDFPNVKWKDSPNNSDKQGFDTLEQAQAELRKVAKAYFTETGCDIIKASFNIDLIMLKDMVEYQDVALSEEIQLGDTISIDYSPYDIKMKKRLTGYTYNILTEKMETLEIGDFGQDYFKGVNDKINNLPSLGDVAEVIDNGMAEKIEEVTNAIISGGNGSYVKFKPNAINPSEILVLDNENEALAKKVIRINKEGIGVSTTGLTGNYYGLLVNGQLVINEATATKIVASIIEGGILTSKDKSSYLNLDNGEFSLKDKISFVNGKFVMKLASGETIENALGGKANNSTVTNLSNKLTDVDSKVLENIRGISNLLNSVTGLETDLSGLNTEITKTNQKVTEIIVENGKITNRVSETEKTTTKLTTDVETAQNTANSKAKTFVATPTIPYKIGDLWLQGTSGEVMKCKVTRNSGNYVATDWEKASKYTDDTKANAVDGRVTTLNGKVNLVEGEIEKTNTKVAEVTTEIGGITTRVSATEKEVTTIDGKVTTATGDINTLKGQVTATNNKVASIESTVNGISSKVSSVESSVTTINGNITSLTSRMATAESKITSNAIINTVSSTINTAKQEAINSANGTTDNKLQNYATTSSLTQTSDSIIAKFSSSGGYNYFKRWIGASMVHPNGVVELQARDGFDSRCKAHRWTYSGTNGTIRFSNIIPKTGVYSVSFYAKSNNSYTLGLSVDVCDIASTESHSRLEAGVWKLFKFENIKVTTVNSTFNFLDINQSWNGSLGWDISLSHICINEGAIALPWTPHPSEIYEGSTVIDGSGVTINNGDITIKDVNGAIALKGHVDGGLQVNNIYGLNGLGFNSGNSKEIMVGSTGNGSAPRLEFRNAGYSFWGAERGNETMEIGMPTNIGGSLVATGRTVLGGGCGNSNQFGNAQLELTNNNGTGNVRLTFHRPGHSYSSITAGSGDTMFIENERSGQFRFRNGNGHVFIGPRNVGCTHYETDRDFHWFNKQVQVNGDMKPYTSGNKWLGSNNPDNKWAGVCCVGGTLGSSDIHTKENIERLDGSLVSFNELDKEILEFQLKHLKKSNRASQSDYYDFIKDRFKPSYYNYKLSDRGTKEGSEFLDVETEYNMFKNVGFIAQDYNLKTDSVAREFIFANEEGELSYNHMSYVTVGMVALQEATRKIESLEAENLELKARLERIEKLLNI